MKQILGAWLATALTFTALDAIWLSIMGPRLYTPVLGELLASKFRLGPAIAFYFIYISGIVALAIWPAENIARAALRGAALGLMAYATYDLTNQATMRVWSTTLTLVDMAWGVFVTSVAAAVGCWAALRLR